MGKIVIHTFDSTVALPVKNTILVTASNDTDVWGGAEMSIKGEIKLNEILVETALQHVFTLILNCKTHVSNIHKPTIHKSTHNIKHRSYSLSVTPYQDYDFGVQTALSLTT